MLIHTGVEQQNCQSVSLKGNVTKHNHVRRHLDDNSTLTRIETRHIFGTYI